VAWREGRVHTNGGIGVQHAEAVGADDAHASLAADAEQLRLPRLAFGARFAEAR
jgi:hypothetical protein